MASSHSNETLSAMAARHLRRLAEIFEEEAGSKPTLAELVEVIEWSAPSKGGCIETPSAVVKIEVRHRRKGRIEGATVSRVDDLGDSVFVDAADTLLALACDLARRFDRPATLPELVAALRDGLDVLPGIVTDFSPGDVVTLEVIEPRSFKRVRAGDIVAIPQGNEGFRIAVVLARNPWGTAFGLFSDTVRVPRPPSSGTRAVVPYAIHTDEQQIVNGVWKVVGNDELLVSLFPEPEIYHAPNRNSPYPELHGHGAAEAADGRLRAISEDEARRVGLADGSYDQVQLSEYLEQRLSRLR